MHAGDKQHPPLFFFLFNECLKKNIDEAKDHSFREICKVVYLLTYLHNVLPGNGTGSGIPRS